MLYYVKLLIILSVISRENTTKIWQESQLDIGNKESLLRVFNFHIIDGLTWRKININQINSTQISLSAILS